MKKKIKYLFTKEQHDYYVFVDAVHLNAGKFYCNECISILNNDTIDDLSEMTEETICLNDHIIGVHIDIRNETIFAKYDVVGYDELKHKTYKMRVPDEFKAVSSKNIEIFNTGVNYAFKKHFTILKSGVTPDGHYNNPTYWCFLIKKGGD